MSAALEILAVVRQWLDKAEGDLRAAVQILKMQEDCPYETVGFHAQQCAEKHLKALASSPLAAEASPALRGD